MQPGCNQSAAKRCNESWIASVSCKQLLAAIFCSKQMQIQRFIVVEWYCSFGVQLLHQIAAERLREPNTNYSAKNRGVQIKTNFLNQLESRSMEKRFEFEWNNFVLNWMKDISTKKYWNAYIKAWRSFSSLHRGQEFQFLSKNVCFQAWPELIRNSWMVKIVKSTLEISTTCQPRLSYKGFCGNTNCRPVITNSIQIFRVLNFMALYSVYVQEARFIFCYLHMVSFDSVLQTFHLCGSQRGCGHFAVC